ncbi:tRNA (adenosine(37)-N6)-threonylcarbamoyltransferase complex dimerization subunit type 1 TsaB [bacterium]|nr:tRNA (adenosine(37)-N6)-threonylcarbamoyltransferase complex dimerization subunit type 1 TsaB [bacterium]
MYRLVLDTALDYSYIAILKDYDIVFESYDLGKNNHSETLFPRLKSALEKLNIKLKDISEVYTGIGPGSYTGVRIAVVIAKMIAAMNNIKLYSFSSLSALVSSMKSECYAYVDSRRGNCYTAHFKYENGKLVRLKEDTIEVTSEYFKGIDKDMIISSLKPDPIALISSDLVNLIEDANSLSPNYLQLVEAERIKMGLK